MAHGCGAEGVGDGVQGQDGAEGTVRGLLHAGEERGVVVSLVFFHGDVGDGGGEKDGLQQGTQERNSHGQEQVEDKKRHIFLSIRLLDLQIYRNFRIFVRLKND